MFATSFAESLLNIGCRQLLWMMLMPIISVPVYTLSSGYNSTTGGEGSGVGIRWWNNGENQIFVAFAPDPEYSPGRLPFNNTGAKIGADTQRGKFWINNGVTEFMTRESVDGYLPGRLSAFSGKQGQHTKGRHWWNNSNTECMSNLAPDSSFIRGRLVKG